MALFNFNNTLLGNKNLLNDQNVKQPQKPLNFTPSPIFSSLLGGIKNIGSKIGSAFSNAQPYQPTQPPQNQNTGGTLFNQPNLIGNFNVPGYTPTQTPQTSQYGPIQQQDQQPIQGPIQQSPTPLPSQAPQNTPQTQAPAPQPVGQGTAPAVPVAQPQQPTPQPPQQPQTTQTPDQAGLNTGNPQLDAFLQNLPQIQQALGIGVETPEQKAFRQQQEGTLNRLIALQENLIKAQAPSDTITNLDKVIQEQTQALRQTSPENLFATTPQFQQAGITQGQLQREAGARRAPIAQALSDLLTSRSILGEQQQQQQQALQNQFSGIQNIAGLQQALQSLQPQQGLPESVQSGILGALTKQAFRTPEEIQTGKLNLELLQQQVKDAQDPINKQIQQAQLANIISQINERNKGSIGTILPDVITPEAEAPILSGIISGQKDATARESSFGAIASFKNAQNIIGLLDQGVQTGPLVGRAKEGLSVFGIPLAPGLRTFGATSQLADQFSAATTAFTANYIKALSGVQVTDKEREFLMNALPSETKQESVNRAGIKELLNFLRNKYELQLGVKFDKFPNEIPDPFNTSLENDFNKYLK